MATLSTKILSDLHYRIILRSDHRGVRKELWFEKWTLHVRGLPIKKVGARFVERFFRVFLDPAGLKTLLIVLWHCCSWMKNFSEKTLQFSIDATVLRVTFYHFFVFQKYVYIPRDLLTKFNLSCYFEPVSTKAQDKNRQKLTNVPFRYSPDEDPLTQIFSHSRLTPWSMFSNGLFRKS